MLDPLIHQETRLRIVAALHRNREMSFADLCRALDLTPGNLSSHAARLTEAGYVASRHALAGLSFEMRFRLTPEGTEAFQGYLSALRALVEEAGAPRPGDPALRQGPAARDEGQPSS